MAENGGAGQINFNENLSALSGFIQRLQEMTAQTTNSQPAIQSLSNVISTLTNNVTALNAALANNTTASHNSTNNTNHMAQSQQHLNQVMNANRVTASGFGSIWAGAFGKGPLAMLDKFHMGLNSITFGIQGLIFATGGRELWNWLIGSNQQIEVLQTSLEVTLKSAEKAESAIRSLRSYAALTPFLEMETFKAGEMFAANGMEIDKWIRIAGDLASAKRTAGVQLEDVVNVLTRVNSGDTGKAMIRLRQMGISLNDLREEGLAFSRNNSYLGSTDEFLGALEQIIQKRYGGLTEALGQTTEGLISTVKDFFVQLGIELGADLFGSLKGSLKGMKGSIMDLLDPGTDAGKGFEKFIKKFNESVASMIQFMKPFFQVIGALGAKLYTMLPMVSKLLQLFIMMKTFSFVLGIFQTMMMNVSVLGRNWAMINAMSVEQVALVNAELVAIHGQNAALTKQTIMTAKLNALRLAGNDILTHGAAATAMQTQLQLAGGRSLVPTVMPLNNSGRLSNAGTQLGAAAGALASRIPQIMIAMLAFQAGSMIIEKVAGSFKEKEEVLNITSSDYDRVIGAEIENVKHLETLSSDRHKVIEDIELYGKANAEAELDTKRLSYTEEMAAGIAEKYADSKSELIRLNEQIAATDIVVGGGLVDLEGKLNDVAGAYDLSTAAIDRGIAKRKEHIGIMYEEKMAAGATEERILKKRIDDSGAIADAVTSQKNPGPTDIWKRDLKTWAGLDLISTMSKKDQRIHEIRMMKNEDDQKNALAEDRYATYEDKLKLDQLKTDRVEYEQGKANGYVNEDGSFDIVRFEKDRKVKEDAAQLLIDRQDATSATFANIQTANETGEKDIKNTYDIRLNDELLKNGNDKESAVYEKIESDKAKALAEYTDKTIKEIEGVYDRAKDGKITELDKVSPALQTIVDAEENFTNEAIISAIEVYRTTNGKVTGEMAKYANEVKLLSDDLLASGKKPRVLTALLSGYKNFAEVTEAMETKRRELELEKRKYQVAATDKAKKAAERTPYDAFNDKWEKERSMKDLNKDILLQNDELTGKYKESSGYVQDENSQSQGIVDFIYGEMNALKNLMSTSAFKASKDYEKEKYEAQVQLLKLEKEANGLLLDIKNNTTKVGEFNKPGFVRALTYYDYKSRDATSSSISISDAKFIMQIANPANLDSGTMVDIVKKSMADFIKRTEHSGVNNDRLFT